MTSEIPDYWFIIHAKPKQEFIAEKNLKAQEIPVYLPLIRKKAKRNKQKIEVIAPLFPGYLFSRFDVKQSYHHVRYTKGIKSILGTDEFLWTIPGDKIQDIRSREEEGIVILEKKRVDFHRGDSILVDDGDFAGWEGIFQEELPDRERAIILLTNIQYSSKLIIPITFLVKHD